MVPVENIDVAVSNIAQTSNLIASNVADFGGYLFPVAGLTVLAAFILYLSPPLVSDD